jgi:hypothetical protein
LAVRGGVRRARRAARPHRRDRRVRTRHGWQPRPGGRGAALAARHPGLRRAAPAGAHVRVALDLRSLPQLAAAVRAGTVKAEQARILTRLLGPIPREQLLAWQDELVQVAASYDPQGLAMWVRHSIGTWCEAQLDHDDQAAHSKRYLQTRDNGDGTTRGSFLLPTSDMEAFHTVLEPLARPVALAGQRTAVQRRADALLDALALAARAADLPDSGGLPTQVHYVVPAGWAANNDPPPFPDTVRASLPSDSRAAGPTTAPAGACAVGVWTGPQTRSRIEAVVCNARISRVLLTPDGQVANLQSLTGEITRAQRRALITRDRAAVPPSTRTGSVRRPLRPREMRTCP